MDLWKINKVTLTTSFFFVFEIWSFFVTFAEKCSQMVFLLEKKILSIVSALGMLMLFILLSFPLCSEASSQFVKVVDASVLNDGDVIVIVNEKSQKALGMESSSAGRWRAVDVSIDGNVIIPDNNVRVFNLGKSGTNYYLKTGDGRYFTGADGLKIDGTTKNGSEWSISCSSDSASVVFKTTKKKLNFKEDTQLFSCYPEYAQYSPVAIYKKMGDDVQKKKTRVLFSGDPIIVVKEGEEELFSSPVASVVDMDGNAVVGAQVVYSCSNAGIADIDADTGVLMFNKNKVFGTFEVSAKYKGDEFYESSESSYTIEYKGKGKLETSISFGDDIDGKSIIVYKGDEQEFLCPQATLTPAGVGEIDYSSSNEQVAKVDVATGNVTFGELGEAVVTASFVGNDDYEKASVSYVIKYLPQSIIFSSSEKSFSKVPESETTGRRNFISQNGTEYEFRLKYAKCSSNKLYLSGSGGSASLMVPLGFDNGYKAIVSYEQSYSENNLKEVLSLCYKVGEDMSEKSYAKLINASGSNGVFEAAIDVPGDYTFVVSAGANQARISKIEIIPNTAINVVLDESVDNTNTISSYKGKVVDASLKRTLVADKWNTFCVPFDIKEAAEMLKGAEIKEYNEQKGVVDDVMYFKKTSSIVAGFPYLIKPTENIENPTFKNVVVSVDAPKSVGNDDYKFVGVFSPLTFDDTMSDTSLFLSGDERLVYPMRGTTMGGMRAYFSFPGDMPAQSAKIFMGDEETSVADVYGTQKANEEKIFNINGVYVGMSLETLPKGVYVKAGKKFVK